MSSALICFEMKEQKNNFIIAKSYPNGWVVSGFVELKRFLRAVVWS